MLEDCLRKRCSSMGWTNWKRKILGIASLFDTPLPSLQTPATRSFIKGVQIGPYVKNLPTSVGPIPCLLFYCYLYLHQFLRSSMCHDSVKQNDRNLVLEETKTKAINPSHKKRNLPTRRENLVLIITLTPITYCYRDEIIVSYLHYPSLLIIVLCRIKSIECEITKFLMFIIKSDSIFIIQTK